MPLIRVKNIDKVYRAGEIEIHALRDVNFSIEQGGLVSFVGPSGSGKTTLLNILGCLDMPTGGDVEVAGMKTTDLGWKERAAFRGSSIGFIFQDFNLMPVLTVYENIEYPLVMIQNIDPAERKNRIERLLDGVGMTDQRDKYPDQISGGQKQRVAIARALATYPKVVLADEPTANLDHATAYLVLELMKKMRDDLGTTFIFSTHDPKITGEAEVIFTLEDGELTGSMKGRKKKTRGRK